MDFGIIHTIYTVVLFASFIGIVMWAYSKKRKHQFDEAANLIFADEDTEKVSTLEQGENKS